MSTQWQQWGKAKRQREKEARTRMTTRTMHLASGFLDSLSASETVARRSRTDRPAAVYSLVCASTVEDRLGIPRICAHSGRTTCSELAQIYYTRSVIQRQNMPPAVPVIVRMPVLEVRWHHRSDYARVCCDTFRSDLAEVTSATQLWCSTAVCTVAALTRRGLSWHKFVVRILCLTGTRWHRRHQLCHWRNN